jgi:predicted ATPase/DNA-binding SARP family transcriptional activator
MTRLSLALLGPTQFTLDGQPISAFYNKARALLAYLAVETNHPHQRDALATLLWPEMPDEAARHSLRQALTNLREAIGDASARPPFLLITRDTIQFNPASNYDLDISTFMALLRACDSHAHRRLEHCRSCATRMQQAISLYGGEFLAGFGVGGSAPFEEWQLRQRERLHQRALDALVRLADYHERRSEDEPARRYAQRQIELEPWREETHRQLMRLLARGGQRSAALAQYETCRRILERDLGVEPEAETTALYEQIRKGERRRQGDKEKNEAFSLSHYLLVSPSPQHNFPATITPLIGRESELVELGSLLENPACRLVTIVGPGGIGKTRLALVAAAEQAEVFADGAAFVPLQAISSAAFVVPAILSALDIPLQGQREPRDQLLDYLRAKELLLVLDNFEQLLTPDQSEHEGGVALLTDILQRAPGITLLVTSRERLALPGEWLFEVPGLNHPTGETINGIEGYDAVQLFVQRAGQVRRQFALADDEARSVARICWLVEGLPLAIELAAAALRTRSCAAIASAIESNLSALASELRAVPERHRSIQATFEHSWRLLSDEERQVFARLSVFRGGCRLEAAASIVLSSEFKVLNTEQGTSKLKTQSSELFTLLSRLVDKSLLHWDGVARYNMHELLRQCAGEKLEESGEAGAVRDQHAAYFLGLAQASEPKLHGSEQMIWLARLEAEHDNLRAGLRWAIDSQQVELGLRLAGALGWFWYIHDHSSEGRRWLAQTLTPTATRVAPDLQIKVLNIAGALARRQGDYASAQAAIETSLALARAAGDYIGIAWSLHLHALIANDMCDYTQAIALSEQSLTLYRQVADSWGIAASLLNLGNALREQGAFEAARVCYDECLTVWQQAGDKRGIAFVLHHQGMMAQLQGDDDRASALLGKSLLLFRELGELFGISWSGSALGCVTRRQGDYRQAAALFEESLALFRKQGDKRNSAFALITLANIAFEQGNDKQTEALSQESLRLSRELDSKPGIAANLEQLAAVAGSRSQPERAARLFGAAQALREASGAALPPDEYQRTLAAAQARLDEASWVAAWAEGQAMTLEQAIAYALEGSQLASASSITITASQ